jgi:SH3 domain-containing YSC84-like protein 1
VQQFPAGGNLAKEGMMLRWAVAFFIIALIAAIFGFGGIAVAAAGIAKILFFIFLVLFLVALLSGLVRRAWALEFDLRKEQHKMRALIRTVLVSSLAIALIAPVTFAQKDEQKRLEESGQVMREILNVKDDIPTHVLDRARCVVVLPSVVKGAFVVGASYGRGAMVCRTGPNYDGPWGAPSMMALEGVSFGFQAGGQATDFVLLVMNRSGINSLLKSKVKLGGDASVAAGPVGRTAEADTDAFMRAEILTYSRSRGVFAGVSLEGATLHSDDDANAALYGRTISARAIIEGPSSPQRPASAQLLDSELEKASPRPHSA